MYLSIMLARLDLASNLVITSISFFVEHLCPNIKYDSDNGLIYAGPRKSSVAFDNEEAAWFDSALRAKEIPSESEFDLDVPQDTHTSVKPTLYDHRPTK